MEHLQVLGRTLYLVNPFSCLHERVNEIPNLDWTSELIPYFIICVFVEHILLRSQGEHGIRLTQGVSNVSIGIMLLMFQTLSKGSLVMAYLFIHENYRIYSLPWNSLTTWVISAICIDFLYYWAHRMSHEINILWASHQVHHSSEDFNLTVSLRHSGLMLLGLWPFYIPLALVLPPTHILVHSQLNGLWGFWSHTEVIKDLGFLEHIFVTPKHHRVHHGSNRYCIDVNYGGVLIIWDKLFGTFQEERKEEKIIYGLVYQPQFFNPLKHLFHYFGKIWDKMQCMKSFQDKMSAIFKGPSWHPGTPRLGDRDEIPKYPDRLKYDPRPSMWIKLYCLGHFVLVLFSWLMISNTNHNQKLTNDQLAWTCLEMTWTLASIGLIFDGHSKAHLCETLRLTAFFLLQPLNLTSWKDFETLTSMQTSFNCVSMIVMSATLMKPKPK